MHSFPAARPRSPIGRWPLFALALVLGAYAWTWHSVAGTPAGRKAQDYYGFLTDAIVSGQLHLKIAPDPRLAGLPNPWKAYQGIPRLHDASYYHGRYYLYFGITPVLILLGPWRLLTHTFLDEGVATVLFGMVGFLAGLDLLRLLVSRLPRPPPPAWIAAGILAWGIGASTFDLIQFPIFYVVPIMAAHACLMVALNAVARCVDAPEFAPAERWLAAASLAWGLAVGARPHYVLSLPAIGMPLAVLWARNGGSWARGRRLRLAGAAVLPAALIGAFLAWYNYARFGTPFEFGQHYQFAAEDQRFVRMWNLSSLGPNLKAYFLQGGLYSLYFPFVIPRGEFIGLAPAFPLALLSLAFPFTLLDRRMRTNRPWLAVGFCALAAGCVHLVCLSILPLGGAYRYLPDYAPCFILVAIATVAYLVGSGPRPGWLSRWIVALIIAALGAVTLAHAALFALQFTRDERTKLAAARLLDRPPALFEKAFGLKPGPIRLELSLDELKVGERAPLVETGVGSDFLYVERVDGGHVRFAFVHLGDPRLTGIPLPFKPGVRHTIVADLGSLYPPDEHPAMKDWSQPMRDTLHRIVKVTLDGSPALVGSSAFFPSDTLHTYVGRDLGFGLDAEYPGAIDRISRVGMPSRQSIEGSGWTGPVRLHLRFPPFAYFISEPLVATGRKGAGDLIYVSYLAPGRLRFGHDSTDGGAIETSEVSFDPGAEHTLDVDLAQLKAPPNTSPDVRRALQLRFDGRWLICADRRMHPTEPFEVVFGFDTLVTGIAKDSFSGALLRPEPIAPLPPPADPGEGSGPLEIAVLFPPPIPGVREPIAVTGRTGAGDFVYITYEANNRVRFGVDHWAVGGVVGDPIETAPQQVHTIVVSSAALFPPATDPSWGSLDATARARILSRIRVDMDGRTVIDAPFTAYPSKPGKVTVGANKIGGSSCGPEFSGQVLSVRRLGMPPAQAR